MSPGGDVERGIFDEEWVATLTHALERDEDFPLRARALWGDLCLGDDVGTVSIVFGRALLAVEDRADPYGTRWRISGSQEQWAVAVHEPGEIFAAIDPRVGSLTFDGDLIGLAANALAFVSIWRAVCGACLVGSSGERLG